MSQRQNPAVPSSHNGPRPAGPTAPEPGSVSYTHLTLPTKA